MKQPGWPHRIGTAAWLVWSGCACGQSVDTSMARATIDQPLSMTVQVRGFDWPASRLTPECLQVHVQQGESGEAITPLRVRTVPSGDDGRVLVQISSPRPVSDTVLTGQLSLLCGADFTREFTVLADPPTTRITPPLQHATPPGPSPTPVPPSAASTAPKPKLGTAALVSPSITRADDFPPTGTPSAGLPRQALEDAEVQRLVTAVVAALSQTASPRSPPEETITAATPPWQALRDEQRQTHASLALLQARIERSEHDLWRDAMLVISAVAALVVGKWMLRLAQESLMPRLGTLDSATPHRPRRKQRTTHHRPLPTHEPAAQAEPSPEPTTRAGIDQGFVHWPLPVVTAPGTDSGDNGNSPTLPLAEHPSQDESRWPDADFGHPSLDTTASTDLLCELEPHATDFPVEVAVVLEQRLQALPGKCPWILLRLLALYEQMQQPWNHERVAAQLEALYNVRIPNMDTKPTAIPADLEAFPDTLHRIEQAWRRDDPATELAALLLKPPTVEVLAPPAFEEVLLLHSIVQRRQSVWLAAATEGLASPPALTVERPRDRLLELLAA